MKYNPDNPGWHYELYKHKPIIIYNYNIYFDSVPASQTPTRDYTPLRYIQNCVANLTVVL
jgi:hypothetical protein